MIALLAGTAVLTFTLAAGRILARVTIERPAEGGTLREGAVGEPRFINPLYASADTDRDLTALVYAGLVRYDGGVAVMDLAEAVDISQDGKAYTARLKTGLRWHDGEPITAGDVAFTIRAIQDPAYTSPLRTNWAGVNVDELSATTIRFSLRQAYAPFMENLAVGILPEHLWRTIPREAAILSDLNVKPIGSGPYRFRKFTRREDGTITSITLARNRDYHLEGPYVDELRFSFYAGEDALAAAYRRNEIDSFLFRSSVIRTELAGLDATVHELRLPKVFGVFLNASVKPLLGRTQVRQALAMAIDRERLIASALGGAGEVADAALPPGVIRADVPAVPYDPLRASELLAEDGWKDSDGDGVRERTEGAGRNRKTMRLELRIATSDAPELAASARLIAEFWRAIGVRAETSILSIGELEAAVIRPRAYEVLVFGEAFGHDPDPFAFWHTSQLKDPGLNIAMYSNRTVDRLLEEARGSADRDLRADRYRAFQEIVRRELGAIFLYRPITYYAIRRPFQGVNLSSIALPADRFTDANRWYAETRRALK